MAAFGPPPGHAAAPSKKRRSFVQPLGSTSVKELARELGVTDQTLYNWKSKYGGMEVSDAKRLRSLEEENRRLKEMVADLSLDREALKTVIRKNGWSL